MTTLRISTLVLTLCILTATSALAGARYEISELLDVNLGVKAGLTKPEDDLSVLYGLALKF